jgi:hypothetical protein
MGQTPLRPTSIGTAGRLQLEWVADITLESPAEFISMRVQKDEYEDKKATILFGGPHQSAG